MRTAGPPHAGTGRVPCCRWHARLGEHDVVGLEITVDHAPAMGLVQGVGDLRSVFQYLIGRERPSTRPGAESFAFEVFQDEIIGTIMFPYVMQNANVGMGELRDGASLALETLAEFRILGQMLGDNFDGDIAVQATVVSAIDFPHPPQRPAEQQSRTARA